MYNGKIGEINSKIKKKNSIYIEKGQIIISIEIDDLFEEKKRIYILK